MASPITPYDGPSQDDVAWQRKIAAQLSGQATDASPVGHWTQALARTLQGGIGGMHRDTAAAGEREGTRAVVNMLRGQTAPTAAQLISNPWTRDVGQRAILEQVKGPEYGKQTNIIQDAQGNFYTLHTNNRGESVTRPLMAGGKPAASAVVQGEDGRSSVVQSGTPLQPSKGVKTIGGAIFDQATGRLVGNVEEAIAAGKKAAEVGETQGKFVGNFPRLSAAVRSWETQAANTDKIIARAINSIGSDGQLVAGFGGYLSGVPTSSARKLRNDLDTIKANIGFDKLQAIRDASPTGGALGAVSDMENRLLQAVQGALDQYDDPASLRTNLSTIRELLGNLRKEKRAAFDADTSRFGGGAQPQGAAPGSGIPAPKPKPRTYNPATGQLE